VSWHPSGPGPVRKRGTISGWPYNQYGWRLERRRREWDGEGISLLHPSLSLVTFSLHTKQNKNAAWPSQQGNEELRGMGNREKKG